MSGLVFNLMGGGGNVNPVARLSISPRPGIAYENGIADMDAATVSALAQAISNNSEVTNTTEAVYFDRGAIHRKVTVGDQITIPVNGKDYAYNIIGFNHDELTTKSSYGFETATGKAGITFEQDCVFDTLYRMHTDASNFGGWEDCDMRKTQMPAIVENLPDAWKNIMQTVNKSTGIGGSTTQNYNIAVTPDTGFLLSYNETIGEAEPMTGYNIKGEGVRYKWYAMGGSTAKKTLSGEYKDHWTRSPYRSNNTAYVYLTAAYGSRTHQSAFESCWLSLAFCV